MFERSDPGSLFMSWQDMHWNDRCQDLSAAHVAEFLARADALPIGVAPASGH